MAVNAQGGAAVSLTVFGGLVTEMAATDLPEGVSPDCQDVEFLPGSVSSRRALKKVFAAPFGTVTVTYGKSLVLPTGNIWNLYLDSAGNLWKEDATNSPGVYTLLQAVQPACYAKSISAFGREYIAINDTLHGADIPLQWDGTNLDRVTQDGPGSPPEVTNLALPSVAMAVTGGAPTYVISAVILNQRAFPGGYFITIDIYAAGVVPAVPIGALVFVSGTGSIFDSAQPYQVIGYNANQGAISCSAFFPAGAASYVGAGTLTQGTGGITLTRQGNYVTVKTAAVHNLQVGYQAAISGPAGPPATAIPPLVVGGGIAQIVINNEDQPGIATITTNSPHGLIPNNSVILQGVAGIGIGTAISSVTWAGGVATVTTTAAHGLVPGALVTIAATGGGAAAFNATITVLAVVSATIFTYILTPLAAPANATGGTVTLNWPFSGSVTPDFFEVIAAPSPTVFQVQINYADAVFTTGTVSFPWDGIFYVTSVPSSTTAVYYHVGPNGTSGTVGTVTPYGQCAPGQHQCFVLFLTRQGYITRRSPPVTFVANGGQYISVSQIPTGPPNVVARILAFTGAGGSQAFYIPAPPQANNQIIGTATQINDNVTTAIVLDFGDNTLFSSIGIDVPGNTLANQIVLDGALGFGLYANRLLTWGQRNRIQNLLNMGFDGGSQPLDGTSGAPIARPTGWTPTALGGLLVGGHITGQAWQVTLATGPGTIKQSAYQDAYGAPILQPNTQYTFRCYITAAPSTLHASIIHATISSASTGFSAAATVDSVLSGNFGQNDFSLPTPAAIPSDMLLTITVTGAGVVTIDEMSIIYTNNPYRDGVMFASYVQNPEAFDGLTGVLGPSQDTHKIMDFGEIRQTGYVLTQDPGGRLHQFSDNGTTEPAGWTFSQVAANCGLVSAFALTKSQADDSSASGGEEWLAWLSMTGPRIFDGQMPWKIGQELQPDFDNMSTGITSGNVGTVGPARLASWALNDPQFRLLYFGIPLDVPGSQSTPGRIYVLSYRELETAYAIGNSPPIKISLAGKLVCTDHTRKWTRWNMTMNGAALMYRYVAPVSSTNAFPTLTVVLFGGNAGQLGATGPGNVYTLNSAKYTDDTYGRIAPYYVIYFLVSNEQEQSLSYEVGGKRMPLGAGRKLLQYLSLQISSPVANCNLTLSYYGNSLANLLAYAIQNRALPTTSTFDQEFGGKVQANRIAIRIETNPTNPGASNDNGFTLSRLTAWLRGARVPVRGSST